MTAQVVGDEAELIGEVRSHLLRPTLPALGETMNEYDGTAGAIARFIDMQLDPVRTRNDVIFHRRFLLVWELGIMARENRFDNGFVDAEISADQIGRFDGR